MANPYREGKGWAIRAQHQGQEIYRSGFASPAAAKRFVEARKVAIDQLGRPARGGPERTVLAVALSDYAVERLPYLKGARQDAQRINNYLRACQLPVIRLTPLASDAGDGAADDGKARVRYWDITLVDEAARPMPNSLRGHRQAQAAAAAPVQAERQRLAGMQFGTICRHHVQALINAMRDAGFDALTIDQERAGLRRLFNHARNVWAWPAPQRNPASGLDLPAIDNRRERVVSNREWDKLLAALNGHRNFYVIPALSFLLHTAMRSSEQLVTARWEDVDWERRVLRLREAKAGRRRVPLGPEAIDILQSLRKVVRERAAKARGSGAGQPDGAGDEGNAGPIFCLSYESLKKAWATACRTAGVEDARMHDLRHTAATRYALEFNGNVFVLKAITGHKTDAMLARYVNITPEMVATMLHKEVLDDDHAPAGTPRKGWVGDELPANVVRLDSRRVV